MQDRTDLATAQQDYDLGYATIMHLVLAARRQGWQPTDRQLVREIMQRERAAEVRQRSSLPILDPQSRSAAWYRGQADALRALLRQRRESY
jgi:hypothetical protein